MDFVKLKTKIDRNCVADVIKIDDHKVKVIYKFSNEIFEKEFTYDQYKSEEEFAAVINTEFDRITQGKINISLK